MDQFLFFNIITYFLKTTDKFSIKYFYNRLRLYLIILLSKKKWRNKVKQGTIIGLALIFVTMITMFSWLIYFYYLIFKPLEKFEFFSSNLEVFFPRISVRRSSSLTSLNLELNLFYFLQIDQQY